MMRDYFNERAAEWDKQSSEKDKGKLERMAARLDLKPGMTVLDIGTGTGVFLHYLAGATHAGGRVIALDIAEKMLFRARSKGISGDIDYICASVEDVPLEAGTCDAAVCYSSFPHFRNRMKALQQIKRVLKNDGWLYVCHTSGRETINRIHSQVPVLHHDLLPDASEMYSLLIMTGFTQVLVEDKEGSYFARARKPALNYG
jgi:demethylmenaquinone methyltransferase/2-methoxy-6-polyprenyl-1,4-benzoquinol methylase